MLIRDWMTKDVVTITPDTSMMRASKIMKEKQIRRLPVVDDKGELVGIVTDRDIKEASPSKATTLDVHELYYLLAEVKIKDIMTSNPYAVSPTDTVERVALTMNEKRIGGLPVVDEKRKVVGIITDSDIFKVLIAITGVRHEGVQLAFDLPNKPGSLKQVLDDLRRYEARIISILTSMKSPDAETREVYIRILPMDRSTENQIIEELKGKYTVIYWARDNVHPLVG
jgi:acetoin utilization protein AcuB